MGASCRFSECWCSLVSASVCSSVLLHEFVFRYFSVSFFLLSSFFCSGASATSLRSVSLLRAFTTFLLISYNNFHTLCYQPECISFSQP